MRTYDLPTLRRSTVGFDRLLNLVNDATADDNYPSFDVERTGENRYLLSLALAGRKKSPSPRSNPHSRSKAARPAMKTATTCTRESACGRFAACSTCPNTCR